MKKIPLGIVGIAAAIGLFAVPAFASDPPPPPDPPVFGATFTFADGDTLFLKADDRFQPIALAPGESVSIAVQLPLAFANAPASAQALDGGQVTADDVVIGDDGTASVGFQAGTAAGRYRLLLSSMGQSVTVQFEVVEP